MRTKPSQQVASPSSVNPPALGSRTPPNHKVVNELIRTLEHYSFSCQRKARRIGALLFVLLGLHPPAWPPPREPPLPAGSAAAPGAWRGSGSTRARRRAGPSRTSGRPWLVGGGACTFRQARPRASEVEQSRAWSGSVDSLQWEEWTQQGQ